jgi:hypothetical protein
MPLFEGNLPDEIWSRLKCWARIRAETDAPLTVEDCVAHVIGTVKDITGRPDALPPDVVTFYANESAEMVDRFRATFRALVNDAMSSDGSDLETAI